ncbi:hypothetical protein FOFC_21426 [Fusarium oxysporum]|nr:hypothetical protein FOFC_21426 [Fusarium oxysporum]
MPTYTASSIVTLIILSANTSAILILRIFAPSHLRIFAPSHLRIFAPSHLRIFASSHLRIFASSHLRTFAPSHLRTFAPSHLRTFAPSHLRIFGVIYRSGYRPMLTKSRSGCRECRFRKVKVPVTKFNPFVQIAVDDMSASSPAIGLRIHMANHRMSDCIGAGSSRMWQDIIPRLSFEHDLVLNPMLALSALHLHSTSPNDAEIEISVRWYLDRALSNHRQALSTEKHVSEQLWLSAILLAHIHWLLVHQTCSDKTYELPLRGFDMFEGVTSLFFQGGVSLQQIGYDWVWNGTLPQVSFNDELLARAETSLRKIEHELLQLFEAFNVSTMDAKVKSIYLSAKDYILRCFRAFYSNTSAQSLRPCVGFMFLKCHAGYRELLERHDPLALAMMARSLVLLHKIDHVWWLNGVGDEFELDDGMAMYASRG